jgi:hypothetical protein
VQSVSSQETFGNLHRKGSAAEKGKVLNTNVVSRHHDTTGQWYNTNTNTNTLNTLEKVQTQICSTRLKKYELNTH